MNASYFLRTIRQQSLFSATSFTAAWWQLAAVLAQGPAQVNGAGRVSGVNGVLALYLQV